VPRAIISVAEMLASPIRGLRPREIATPLQFGASFGTLDSRSTLEWAGRIAAKRAETGQCILPLRGEMDMLRTDILAFLRCPEDHSELTAASEKVVNQLNAATRQGQVANRLGKRLTDVIDGGLIRADGIVLYPIIDQIPILLWDDAIPLDQLADHTGE
jgi:uncharacterized protein YbaR (Trm112 family)